METKKKGGREGGREEGGRVKKEKKLQRPPSLTNAILVVDVHYWLCVWSQLIVIEPYVHPLVLHYGLQNKREEEEEEEVDEREEMVVDEEKEMDEREEEEGVMARD